MSVLDAANGYQTTMGGYMQPHHQHHGPPPPTQYPGHYPVQAPLPPQHPAYGMAPPPGKAAKSIYQAASLLQRSNSAMP